jgi:Spy/CpxP family protein refolding chaperone
MRPGKSNALTAWLFLALSLATTSTLAQGPPGMPFPPGGMGGGPGGPGGFGGPSLVMAEAVQEDLGLTDKQKTQIKKLKTSMDQRARELFENAREGGVEPQEMMESMTSLNRDHNAAVAKVLDKTQKARLAQIELQREGLLVVAKADIAGKLKLSTPQTKKIKIIVDEMRQAMFKGMPGPPGGGPPPGSGAPAVKGRPSTKKARRAPPENGGDSDEEMPPGGEGFPRGGPPGQAGLGEDRAGRPDFNSEEFRARFAKMMEEQKKTRDTAIEKIGEVLTPEQKAAYDKLIGKPFDFTKIPFGPPGGKPPGEDTPKAEEGATKDSEDMEKTDAPTKTKATPKTRKSANP